MPYSAVVRKKRVISSLIHNRTFFEETKYIDEKIQVN
jgi:hypothetical protein